MTAVSDNAEPDARITLVSVTDLLWSRMAALPYMEVRTPLYTHAVATMVDSIAGFAEQAQVDYVLNLTAAAGSSADHVQLQVDLYAPDARGQLLHTPMRTMEFPRLQKDEDLSVFLQQREVLVHRVATEVGAFFEESTYAGAPASTEAWRLYLLARDQLHTLTCDNTGARSLLERVVEMDPDFVLGWIVLGFAHYNAAWACASGRDAANRALEAVAKAHQLAPNNAPATFLQASLLTELGDPQQALEILSRENSVIDNAMLLTAMAYVQTYLGNLDISGSSL